MNIDPLKKDFLQTVPESSGIYLMQDAKGRVIYVGKARNLRKRLASYFRHSSSLSVKTVALVRRIHAIETILTATEKEAFILEAAQIKKYRPRYNVILRDDKNYPLIKVTVNETWPRVLMTRRRARDGAKYFGPYTSSGAMWTVLRMLQKVFPLRRCKGGKLKKRVRPCLNYQMQACLAPCAGLADPVKYRKQVDAVLRLLEGKNGQVVGELEEAMLAAASRLEFEQAALSRDRLEALKKTLEKQVVVARHFRDQDIFGFVRSGVSVGLTILQVRNGVIMAQRSFFMAEALGSDQEILLQALQGFYEDENVAPHEILLPFEPDSVDLLADSLTMQRGSNVTLRVPKRGEGTRLLEMAKLNAAEIFAEREKKERTWRSLAKQMAKELHLQRDPERIECLDISNLSGQQAVGSLVCFTIGEADKKEYRHYRIKEVEGPDDYAMMYEVLSRRFAKEKQAQLPDLLLLDGGKGQLNVAVRVLKEFGLTGQLDLLGIAKEKGDEGEKIFLPNRKNPLIFRRNSPVLLFLMRIRDESHRFGIDFHRKLRRKKTLRSTLDQIPGVGPEKKRLLLKEFGSVKRVSAALETELAGVAGVGPKLARVIWAFLHPSDQVR